MFSAIFLLVTVVSCMFAAPNINVVKLAYEEIKDAPVISPFIVGGSNTTIQKFPSVVSLSISFGSYGVLCGGTIIHSLWIVTAAHCFYDDEGNFAATSVKARAESNSYSSGGKEYSVTTIVTFGYDPSSFLHDIALLKVTPTITLGKPTCNSIPLPPVGFRPPVGATVEIVGWGTTSEGGSLPKQLQAANVTVFDQSVTRAAYGDIIKDSMFGAGHPDGGKDSCQGDSGGPAFYKPPEIIVGIVSFGYGCARKGYPGIYTNVGFYRDVIAYVIQNL